MKRGNESPVFELDFATVGILTCYDGDTKRLVRSICELLSRFRICILCCKTRLARQVNFPRAYRSVLPIPTVERPVLHIMNNKHYSTTNHNMTMGSKKEGVTEKKYGENELKYLDLLAEKFPTVQAASTEIINLQSILNLPSVSLL